MRVTDELNLKWSQVFFSQQYISHRIAKTNTPQKLPLYNQLNDFLLTFKKSEGKLFNYQSRSSLQFWNRALKQLELPHYSLHQIRKTTITELIHQGFDFETIHIFSGHADPKTTWKHYVATRNLMQAHKFNPTL